MAVVDLKSSAITNADASPRVLNPRTIAAGDLRENVATKEVTNGDSIASIFRMLRVKSSDRISRLLVSCDAITSATADFGIYKATAEGGAVVDVDFFASAQAISSALVHTDITHEADPADAGAGYGHADVEKPLWQALGLSADPMVDYDICATLTAAATATGTLSLKVQYVNMA